MSVFTESMHRLRSAGKSNSGAPAYSRFVNRPLGRVLAAAAHAAGRTPNQVTFLSSIFTFSGIALIFAVRPTVLMAVGVFLLLLIGYALDSADGQLARLRGGGSITGEWLDHMSDAVKMASLHLAVLVCWYRFYDLPDAMLAVPIGYQVVTTVFYLGVILTEILRRSVGGAGATAGRARNHALYAVAVLPADYGLMIVLMLLLAWQDGFTVLYTLVAAAHTMILLLSLVRWYRSLQRASAAAVS